MTQRITWAEAKARGIQEQLRKMELKALKRSLPDAEMVILRAIGVKQVEQFTARGWTVISSVPLGRGAGFTSYLMQKKRSEVEFRPAGVEDIVNWVFNHHEKFPGQTSESFILGFKVVVQLSKDTF